MEQEAIYPKSLGICAAGSLWTLGDEPTSHKLTPKSLRAYEPKSLCVVGFQHMNKKVLLTWRACELGYTKQDSLLKYNPENFHDSSVNCKSQVAFPVHELRWH